MQAGNGARTLLHQLMQAIQTILQMIAAAGDEIILPTPAWPNYAGPMLTKGSTAIEGFSGEGACCVAGARPRSPPLR